jgi:16S rRNA (adenine1518-N6/adenine1519-N6)-dimethyltransferase
MRLGAMKGSGQIAVASSYMIRTNVEHKARMMSNVKSLIKRHEHTVRKRLGQHFLTDRKALGRIAEAITERVQSGGSTHALPVVEVGPGPGTLTRLLLDAGHTVVGLELDKTFESIYQEEFVEELETGKFQLIWGDAMDFSADQLYEVLAELNPDQAPTDYILAGNIPYQITSPLLFKGIDLMRESPGARAMIFLMQEEVAQRAVAKPNTKRYGALSARLQLVTEPKLGLKLGAGAFWPPPKVASRLLIVDPMPDAQLPSNESLKPTNHLIEILFQHRRKMIATTLFQRKGMQRELVQHALEVMGKPATARPEDLAASEFVQLAQALGKSPGASQSQ